MSLFNGDWTRGQTARGAKKKTCQGHLNRRHGVFQQVRSTRHIGKSRAQLQTALVRPTRLLRVEEREPTTSMKIRGPTKAIAPPLPTLREILSKTRCLKRMKSWSLLGMTQFTRHCMWDRVALVVRQCLPCLCINSGRRRPY